MKQLSLVTLIVGALIFVAGCEGSLSSVAPTSPQLVSPGILAAATVNHIEEKVPLELFVFVPCANDGAGELVVADGELHIVAQLVIDNRGGLHVSGHFQPIRNVDGVGQVTGDVYHGVGVSRDNFNEVADGFPLEFTSINNFRWIGPGPNNNLLVHATMHLTVNANGRVTAVVDNSSVECR